MLLQDGAPRGGREETQREGLDGISPRYVQDKISNALVNDAGQGTINPFMVLNELEKGLSASLTVGEDQRKRYAELISVVKAEYDEIVKNEKRRLIEDVDVLYVTRVQKERFTDLAQYEEVKSYYVINPEIMEARDERRDFDGCLSFPSLYANTVRPHNLRVSA